MADGIRWFIDNVAKPFGSFFGTEMPNSIATTNASLQQMSVILGQEMPTAIAALSNSIADKLNFSDRVNASVSRAPAAWGDTLGISDRITATAALATKTLASTLACQRLRN